MEDLRSSLSPDTTPPPSLLQKSSSPDQVGVPQCDRKPKDPSVLKTLRGLNL